MTVRVLIADDQKIIRDGLSMLLGLLPDVEVVGAAVDGDDAVRQVASTAPDVVLMDLDMPRCDGVEATRRVVRDHPATRVVVLTTYSDDDSVFRALRAGARGFLTKDAGAEEIRAALTTVASGEAQLDPSVQRRLLEALAVDPGTADPTAPDRRLPQSRSATPAGSDGAPGGPPDGLTPREVEVLVEIAGGLSNPEIARRLVVSEATVKTHVNHLLAKTGMRDRAQLVAYAFRHRLAR